MTDRATETWASIERLLVEECGLLPDQGLATERPNLINAIRNHIDQQTLRSAIEFMTSGQGLHRIRVNGKMMARPDVAEALKAYALTVKE